MGTTELASEWKFWIVIPLYSGISVPVSVVYRGVIKMGFDSSRTHTSL